MPKPKSAKVHPAALKVDDLMAQCTVERTRRGGPGGQHRNKTETAIVLLHKKTGVSGQAGERRSQNENREVAIARLRLNLALAVRTAKDVSKPDLSELWKSRVAAKRISISTKHVDFPAVLAEALDWVSTCELNLTEAAKQLRLSTSQLVKLLKQIPDAWQMVQQKRHERGLPRLK